MALLSFSAFTFKIKKKLMLLPGATITNHTGDALVTEDGGVDVAAIDADSTMAANSDAVVPSQKAVKTTLALKADVNTECLTLLASDVTVNTDTGTKQTLYTVPAGKKCIVTHVVLRTASTSLGAITDVASIGFDSGATDFGSFAVDILSALTDATKYAILSVAGKDEIISKVAVIGNETDVLGVIFADTSITGTVKVDVLGYLY